MSSLLELIIADLRAASEELLELGLGSVSSAPQRAASAGCSSFLIETINHVGRLVPELLDELEELGQGELTERSTRRPVRARLSRRSADYVLDRGTLRPQVFLVLEPRPAVPADCLRYLLHLIERLRAALEVAVERHDRMADQVRAAREGGRGWELYDLPQLRARERVLHGGRLVLDRAVSRAIASAGMEIRPSPRRPKFVPKTRSWDRLRSLLPRVERPFGSPVEEVGHLLSGSAELPDLPFLYQRWCGLQIHESLTQLGFRWSGDLGATLLGAGRLRYSLDGAWIDLWVEPRLRAGVPHESGFTCAEGREATPDFLLITPGPEGPDAVVLDATLAVDDDRLMEKGAYMDRLRSVEFGRVAGVPTSPRPPLRAWAMAPLASPRCRHLDGRTRRGLIGAVPATPAARKQRALDAFLGDVAAASHAWRAR